jgi:hypothetical protein
MVEYSTTSFNNIHMEKEKYSMMWHGICFKFPFLFT